MLVTKLAAVFSARSQRVVGYALRIQGHAALHHEQQHKNGKTHHAEGQHAAKVALPAHLPFGLIPMMRYRPRSHGASIFCSKNGSPSITLPM